MRIICSGSNCLLLNVRFTVVMGIKWHQKSKEEMRRTIAHKYMKRTHVVGLSIHAINMCPLPEWLPTKLSSSDHRGGRATRRDCTITRRCCQPNYAFIEVLCYETYDSGRTGPLGNAGAQRKDVYHLFSPFHRYSTDMHCIGDVAILEHLATEEKTVRLVGIQSRL